MHPLAAPGALWVLSRAGKVPRPPAGGRNLSQETHSLWRAGESPLFAFPFRRVSHLRVRPGGFPIAPWTPSGPIPIYVGETSHKEHVPCEGQGKRALLFFCFLGDFASAEATKGLSGRPWETFGPFAVDENCTNLQQMRTMQICNRWKLCKFVADKHCKNSFL